jgi:hypothetical protein
MTDAPIQTDTPVPQPPSRAETVKAFIGDLARPFAIIVTALSAAVTPIIIAFRVGAPSLEGAAIFMGAIYAGVGAMFGAKAWENTKQAQATADVAKANGPTP